MNNKVFIPESIVDTSDIDLKQNKKQKKYTQDEYDDLIVKINKLTYDNEELLKKYNQTFSELETYKNDLKKYVDKFNKLVKIFNMLLSEYLD